MDLENIRRGAGKERGGGEREMEVDGICVDNICISKKVPKPVKGGGGCVAYSSAYTILPAPYCEYRKHEGNILGEVKRRYLH
jgi:hypothetical protein